jgi:hypothetical protein
MRFKPASDSAFDLLSVIKVPFVVIETSSIHFAPKRTMASRSRLIVGSPPVILRFFMPKDGQREMRDEK